ncbi:MAG: FAD-dependent oxidoreductase [Solirubrobacteraceae bacterium]
MTTRRGFIGGAAVGAAAAAAPGAEAAAKGARRADVVVVGAGFAGLAAASAVRAAGKSVIVLEARRRVGGRILNQPIGGGEVIEIGGQWVGTTQDKLLALAENLGVSTYKTYNTGDTRGFAPYGRASRRPNPRLAFTL